MSSPVRYKYILSLPERVVRSLGALSGGLLREVGNVALPASVRRTTLYRTMVEVALRFLIEEVGQVEGVYPSEERLAENFLLKRTASHGIELLGILAFHASPIWVLAALADATGGGRKLIQEIAEALKEEGLLASDARFETMEQVLHGLETTSDHVATTLNMPPVDIAGLRREWVQLRRELTTIPPMNVPALPRIEGVWKDLEAAAKQQGRSIFGMSSLLAVSTVAHVPANLLWLSRAARDACSAIPFWTTTPPRWRKSRAPGSSSTGRGSSAPTCAARPSSSPRDANRSPSACSHISTYPVEFRALRFLCAPPATNAWILLFRPPCS